MPSRPTGSDSQAMSEQLGLASTVVDQSALDESVARCSKNNVVLPTFAQLADPSAIPPEIARGADKNAPDARNLFRVHWFNSLAGERVPGTAVGLVDSYICEDLVLIERML